MRHIKAKAGKIEFKDGETRGYNGIELDLYESGLLVISRHFEDVKDLDIFPPNSYKRLYLYDEEVERE